MPVPAARNGMTDSQKWLTLACSAALGWFFYRLAPILMPFAVSAALAYLGDPLVDRLERYNYRGFRLNRTLSVLLVFSGISFVLATLYIIVVPALEYQVTELLDKLPAYLAAFNRSVVPVLQKYLGRGIRPLQTDQLAQLIRNQWQNGSDGQNLIQSVSHSGAVVIGWALNLILIPVISFYLLRDWDKLMTQIHDLFPRRYSRLVTKLAREADEVLGAFLRGQFYVMLIMGLVYSFGLWLVDLQLALLVGLLTGLLGFIPYMGIIIGVGTGCLAALLQFENGMHIMPVLMVFAAGYSFDSMWLTPWLVGNRIGLHPVAVIFAVLAGGQLFGFLGVLLALPVASVVMVLVRHAHDRYTVSRFYSISDS